MQGYQYEHRLTDTMSAPVHKVRGRALYMKAVRKVRRREKNEGRSRLMRDRPFCCDLIGFNEYHRNRKQYRKPRSGYPMKPLTRSRTMSCLMTTLTRTMYLFHPIHRNSTVVSILCRPMKCPSTKKKGYCSHRYSSRIPFLRRSPSNRKMTDHPSFLYIRPLRPI